MPFFVAHVGSTDPVGVTYSRIPRKKVIGDVLVELGTLPHPCSVADLILMSRQKSTQGEADAEKATFDGQANKATYVQDELLRELTARGFIDNAASVPQLKAVAKKLGISGYSNKTKSELQDMLRRV